MEWFEAIILGIIQGLTEFLPISSSGHLELGKHFFQIHAEESFVFSVLVHGATVLSTLVVFRKEILRLIKGLFAFRWNEETRYVALLLFSMIPVGIVGVLFEEKIEGLFTGNVRMVGMMLWVTALLLTFSFFSGEKARKPSWGSAILMGIAQAMAVIPGISRSGATISTGLILGNNREETTRFSFLMVLLPVIGANVLQLLKTDLGGNTTVSPANLFLGFVAAFVFGILACTWMIGIVKKGRLIYFAAYCFLAGLLAVLLA